LPETNRNIVGGAKRVWQFLLCWLPLAAAVVAASLLSGCAAQSPRPSEEASQGDAELGHPALGHPGAPVVMVEYGDFQ
jgi:hypothetical protein